jgi:hypothetical protein
VASVSRGRSGISIQDTGEIKAFGNLTLDLSVGIQPEDADQPHHSGMTLGELGAVHEYGGGRVPARMWFRGWAAQYEGQVRDAVRAQLQQMVRTQRFAPGALQNIAHRMKATLVGRIAAGQITPPNAPATLLKKAPEIRPLVETKAFMRAIQAAFRARTSGGNGGALTWKYKTGGGAGGGGS